MENPSNLRELDESSLRQSPRCATILIMAKSCGRFATTFLISLVVPSLWGQAQSEASADKTPAHVYQEVALLRAELELIRLEMGKGEVETPPFRVEKAEPREVYFQALTLFQKANRLAFEHTHEQIDKPKPPQGGIAPKHVFMVVTAALERVRTVKTALGISDEAEAPAIDAAKEPSDVFNSIVSANRELNRLLDRKYAPGDVYQEVTLAIAYLSRLLDSPGEVSSPPEPPTFERRKRPEDVYEKLVGCFGEVRAIGEMSGVPMLNLLVEADQIAGAEPSDVYDIAALLVSELDHLHTESGEAAPPRKVFNPGRKLPSHVYQRIGIVCSQMEQLLRKVEENPDWLKD
ncbi:MAG: hypothetical protein ACI8UO_006421 [Verrucomicrobiales bacterium]|jgi:hypothetical protein